MDNIPSDLDYVFMMLDSEIREYDALVKNYFNIHPESDKYDLVYDLVYNQMIGARDALMMFKNNIVEVLKS